MLRSSTDLVMDEWSMDLPSISTIINANSKATRGEGEGGNTKKRKLSTTFVMPPSPPPKTRKINNISSTPTTVRTPEPTHTTTNAGGTSSRDDEFAPPPKATAASAAPHVLPTTPQATGKSAAEHNGGRTPLALADDVISRYHAECEDQGGGENSDHQQQMGVMTHDSARQKVQHTISQLVKQSEIRAGCGHALDAARSDAESARLVKFLNDIDEPPADLGSISGKSGYAAAAAASVADDDYAPMWRLPPSPIALPAPASSWQPPPPPPSPPAVAETVTTSQQQAANDGSAVTEVKVKVEEVVEGGREGITFDSDENDPSLFAALHGDSKSAKALRAVMSNTHVGIDGLSNVAKAQSLNGTVIHDPRASQLPMLRPQLRSIDVWDGMSPSQFVRIGVKEICHRKVFSSKYDKVRKPHHLFLFGVLPDGKSIDLEVRDFRPSFYVVADRKWSSTDMARLHDDLNLTLLVANGGSKYVNANKRGRGSNTRSQPPPPIVFSVKRVERTPTIGFSNMRRDFLLKITVSNACHTAAVAHELREVRGMRVIHDDWHVDQQLIHAMQKKSPVSLDNNHPQAWAPIDKTKGLKLNRWVKIRRRDLEMMVKPEQRQTTGQLQCSVRWNQIQPEPECDDALPLLTAQFDGEMISQHQFETGIDSFPQAQNKRDKCISLSAVLNVNGYSHKGSFLRVVFAVGSSLPIPGCIVYTFSSEALMLAAFRQWLVDHCDVDAIGGYNSKDFDMPYLMNRAQIVKCPDFFKWSRFSRDKCRMPTEDFPSVQIEGRWQLDLMKIVMSRWKSKFSTFSLRVVADSLIKSGVNKVDMPYRDIAHHFHAPDDKPEGRTKVNFYCIIDSILCEMMDRGNSMFSAYLAICKLTNTRFEDVMRGGQQIRVYNMCIERIHHYRWYENKFLMEEKTCYREPVPLDWNGYTEGHHLHELLSKARHAGLIEPDSGFEFGDPRAKARDKIWKKVLIKSFVLEKKNDVEWAASSAEHKKQACDAFVHGLMYETDALRKNAGHKKRKADMIDQSVLSFAPVDSSEPAVTNTKRQRATLNGVETSLCAAGNNSSSGDDSPVSPEAAAGGDEVTSSGEPPSLSPETAAAEQDGDDDDDDNDEDGNCNSDARRKRQKTTPNGAPLYTGTRLEDVQRLEEALYRDSPVAEPGHKRKFYPGDRPLGAAPRNKAEKEGMSGGCVFRSLRGVWEVLFAILDFASLYPSIIQAQMVDYASLVYEERYMNLPGFTYRRVAYMGYFYYWVVVDPARLSSTEHIKAVKAGKEIPKPLTQTILPVILTELVTARRDVKKLMKTEKDSFRKATLDNEQAALKIVCNAAYGFLKVNVGGEHDKGGGDEAGKDGDDVGEPSSKRRKVSVESYCSQGSAGNKRGRAQGAGQGGKPPKCKAKAYLSCPPLSFIVTSTGRDMIRLVKYFGEVEQGTQTVYGDTDSVMQTAPHLLKIRNSGAPDAERQYEKAFEQLCERIVQRCNSFFLYPNEMENENTCKLGYFDKKKMYAYMAHFFLLDENEQFVLDADGDRILLPKTKLTIKGMIKRDKCKAVRDIIAKIVREYIVFNKIEPVKALVREFVVKLGKNEVPLSDLSISAAFNPKTQTNAAVRPYTFMKESRRKGVMYGEGNRMQYIMRAPKMKDEKDYMRGEELQYAKEQNMVADAEYYFSQQLKNPVSTLLQFHMDPDKFFAEMHELMTDHMRRRAIPDSAKNMFKTSADKLTAEAPDSTSVTPTSGCDAADDSEDAAEFKYGETKPDEQEYEEEFSDDDE